MSLYYINNYYNELEKIIHYGGSKKETAIGGAFYKWILNQYKEKKPGDPTITEKFNTYRLLIIKKK